MATGSVAATATSGTLVPAASSVQGVPAAPFPPLAPVAAQAPPPRPQEAGAWDGIERRSGLDRRSGYEDRASRRYRFIDRRSGFDRRKRYPVTGTLRDYPLALVALLLWLNLLSIVDGIFTLGEINHGIAVEGNPVLVAAWYLGGDLGPVLIKLGGIFTASLVIWFGRRRRIILQFALFGLALYSALVAYHISLLTRTGHL